MRAYRLTGKAKGAGPGKFWHLMADDKCIAVCRAKPSGFADGWDDISKPPEAATCLKCLELHQQRQERKAAKKSMAAKPKVPKMRTPEAAEQRMLATWLNAMGLLWAHVPNGGKRTMPAALELKRQGVKPGVPDVLIFTTPPKMPTVRGVAIELKGLDGGRLSAAQGAWIEALRRVGWRCYVACGHKDAIEYLRTEMGYGYGD